MFEFKEPSKIHMEGYEAAKRGVPEYCVPDAYRFTELEDEWVNGHVNYWLDIED